MASTVNVIRAIWLDPFSPLDESDKARNILRHKVDWLKLIATGAVLTVGTEPGQPELTEGEMRVAVEEARKYGVKVTAHAHGAEGAKMAMCDGGWTPVIGGIKRKARALKRSLKQ